MRPFGHGFVFEQSHEGFTVELVVRRSRHLGEITNFLGDLVRLESASEEPAQFRSGIGMIAKIRTARRYEEGARSPGSRRDHDRMLNIFRFSAGRLDLGTADPKTAHFEDVVTPPFAIEVTFGIHSAVIAGMQAAQGCVAGTIGGVRECLRIPVAGHQMRPGDDELAGLARRQGLPCLVHDLDTRAAQRHPAGTGPRQIGINLRNAHPLVLGQPVHQLETEVRKRITQDPDEAHQDKQRWVLR